MAEEFLTLMADLDADTQKRMSAWYAALRSAGFTGVQTPGLPFHISLAAFPLNHENEAIERMKKAAAANAPIPVHISHIGLLAGGKVLFCAPERSRRLDALHDACDAFPNTKYPWTPHATILIDAPVAVCSALPVLLRHFHPFVGRITRLHLCAFWPTREIASAELTGETREQRSTPIGK